MVIFQPRGTADAPRIAWQKKTERVRAVRMSGNVEEWCQDWYGQDYYANSPADDPQGPATGSYHVLRGGAGSIRGELLVRRCAITTLQARTDYRSVGFGIACSP